MENISLSKLQEVLTDLDRYTAYFRAQYMGALDTDDLEIAQKEQTTAFENIQRIKSIRQQILHIIDEISVISPTLELASPSEAPPIIITPPPIKTPINSSTQPPIQHSAPAPVPAPTPSPAPAPKTIQSKSSSSNVSFFEAIENLMYSKPYIIASLPYKTTYSNYFSLTPTQMQNPKRLTNGIYIETALDEDCTNAILKDLAQL